jgi:hypothetical protein
VGLALARAVAWGAAAAPPPRRLFVFMQNNGTQQANFWPAGPAFTSPILEPLLKHPSVAAKTTLVRGVFMPGDANGTSANQHDQGFARLFTGARLLSVGGRPWGGGPSVDQILAQAWGGSSLTLAVLTSRPEPRPKSGFDHRRSFSYVAAGRHKLPAVDPFVVYQSLFGEGAPPAAGARPDPALGRRLALRKSVLDTVSGNLREVSARLGPAERMKLDEHAAAIRQLEARLGASLGPAAGGEAPAAPSPAARACASRPSAPRSFAATPALLLNDESAIPELVTSLIDLAAVALACGLTRVASLQFGYGGGKWMFGWEGININHHDGIAHRDSSDAGTSPENTERVVKINRYFAAQVARLALALEAIPEAGGTALDNTLIVWGNELGRGDHSLRNIPVVLVGKAGGALPAGGKVIDAGPQVFNRLGCTILNAMGTRASGFGDAPECGSFQGIALA